MYKIKDLNNNCIYYRRLPRKSKKRVKNRLIADYNLNTKVDYTNFYITHLTYDVYIMSFDMKKSNRKLQLGKFELFS